MKLQKLLIFLQQKYHVFENTLTTTVNEFVIYELVKLTMLWTIEPCIIYQDNPTYKPICCSTKDGLNITEFYCINP